MTGDFKGYHPGDYSYPQSSTHQFEIALGAILTQNTAWRNVEKALLQLQSARSLSAKKIKQLDINTLKQLIRPAGYYNQKAQYIKNYCDFFSSLKGSVPTRALLLSCKGIGNETADSILLYAYSQPEFVIDTYTKRIFFALGLCKQDESYMTLKTLCEQNLDKDVQLYQEYHALLVEHAKRYYSKKPYGVDDPLPVHCKKKLL